MKLLLHIVLITVVLMIGTGLYLQYTHLTIGRKITGIGVLMLAFVLLPLFIYQRYKNKKAADYMLDKEKINKILDNLRM